MPLTWRVKVMLQMFWDGLNWATRHVNGFHTRDWVIAFVILLAIGGICLRGLGIRGAR
jgi:hypothetical protein